jgi:hypothetical protein
MLDPQPTRVNCGGGALVAIAVDLDPARGGLMQLFLTSQKNQAPRATSSERTEVQMAEGEAAPEMAG